VVEVVGGLIESIKFNDKVKVHLAFLKLILCKVVVLKQQDG
jgi:hypothetical protein